MKQIKKVINVKLNVFKNRQRLNQYFKNNLRIAIRIFILLRLNILLLDIFVFIYFKSKAIIEKYNFVLY